MNEKLDYKFGKYDLDFLIKLKAHEFRKQKIDNISEKEIRNYLFNKKVAHCILNSVQLFYCDFRSIK